MIKIDYEKCMGLICSLCESISPDTFCEVDGQIVVTAPDAKDARSLVAVDACPVRCITFSSSPPES